MDKTQVLSLGMSALALLVSAVTGYIQYQTRQDTIEERVKVELKMAQDDNILSPLDLRMLSGVEERASLEAAILVTNLGNTSVRIREVGYQDQDLPRHAFYSTPETAKNLASGEQAMFKISDLISIERQLVEDIRLGEGKKAKIFATSSRGNRFEAPARIEVPK